MKKRILPVFIAICFGCSILSHVAWAATEYFYTDGRMHVLYYTLDEDGNAVIQRTHKGDGGSWVIPAQIDGHPVTRIEFFGFTEEPGWDEYPLFLSVAIPNTVTSIGFEAFFKFNNLTKIKIPDSVTSIGGSAFSMCESLKDVTLPNSITSIEQATFYGCSKLTNITIPDSVTVIGPQAFHQCINLGTINIPDTVTKIGYSAFYNALDEVVLPSALTAIENDTFASCRFKEIEIPSKVVSIGRAAFYHCEHLEEIIVPDSVISIGDRAFATCKSLSHVVLGNSVTSIGPYAFAVCDNLNYIQIPKNVTSIGTRAFGYMWEEKLDDFTVSGYCGTAAETYAMENGFTFERIHDPVDVEGTLPTCTEPGVSGGTKCAGCGEILSTGNTVIPATGHIPGDNWEQDPSSHWHVCKTCTEALDIADHSYGDWRITKEPTDTAVGQKERSCTTCGYTQSETIPMTEPVTPTPTPTPTLTPTPTPTPTPPSRPSGGGGSSSYSPPTYTITIPAISHGKVTTSPSRAEKGDKVTLTVTPDEGYKLDSLTVSDSSGKILTLTELGNGKYTFTMPGSKVDIKASFAEEKPAPTAFSNPFTDISVTNLHYSAVAYVCEKDIMKGLTATTFGPNVSASRAMVVTLLHRMEGEPKAVSATFSDVPAKAYYAAPVAWANSRGIVTGHQDGTFRPNDGVTLEQLATILYRYAGAKGYDQTSRANLNTSQISSYAREPMSWMLAQGLLDNIQYRDPKTSVTRSEIAEILMHFCENVAK